MAKAASASGLCAGGGLRRGQGSPPVANTLLNFREDCRVHDQVFPAARTGERPTERICIFRPGRPFVGDLRVAEIKHLHRVAAVVGL